MKLIGGLLNPDLSNELQAQSTIIKILKLDDEVFPSEKNGFSDLKIEDLYNKKAYRHIHEVAKQS